MATPRIGGPPGRDAGPHFVRESYQVMLECTDVRPTFRKHPAFFGGITNVAWSFDRDVELDGHLRRSALPEPGRVRDLLELASRLHGSLLDRTSSRGWRTGANFGLVGCRRSVPHLQRLLGHLETSFKDLERAFGA